jgi:hypothetical protein
MNSKTIIAISCAIAVTGAPVKSQARADKSGLKACATAMTEQLTAAQGAPVDYRLEEGPATTGQRGANAGVWYLDARDARTQEVVARINCYVNSRAQVTRLTEVPLSANDARLRAGEY